MILSFYILKNMEEIDSSFESKKQLPTIFSLSALKNIQIPEEYTYGKCKSVYTILITSTCYLK